jgi:hypothetical protein
MGTDYRNYQRGTEKTETQLVEELTLLKQQTEIRDKNHCRQFGLSGQYGTGIRQLRKIFELLPVESTIRPDDLPISFVDVETELARCISQCLADVHPQNRGIEEILTLVSDYRVVRLLPDGTPTVSLHNVLEILQDSFPGSCFCKFLNIMLAEWMGVRGKSITF